MCVFGCVLRSCFCLIGFICHDVADIKFFIITAVADLLVGAAGVFVRRWMWRGTGGKGRRQAACLCLAARREVAETMCLTFDIHTPNGSGIYIHTHTRTHAPSVTGPWQAWPRRGGWAKRRWREAEGGEAECRTPPAILHPLFPSLSLGPSFLIPWQWPCAPPLLSRSHTHTHTGAGCPCQPHKTDTSSAQWPLFLPPSVISTDRMSKEGLGWRGGGLPYIHATAVKLPQGGGVCWGGGHYNLEWNFIPKSANIAIVKGKALKTRAGWGRVGWGIHVQIADVETC